MKIKGTIFGLLMCLGFAAGIVHAEDEINSVPHAPFLNPVPDYGHWTVSFKYPPPPKTDDSKPEAAPAPTPAASPSAASAPTPPVSKIDIIKTGDMMLVTVYTPSGPPKIYYQRGDWVVTLDPQNAQQAEVLVPSPNHLPYPFFTDGFMMMEGMVLGSDNFKGLVKYNGIPAYNYQTPLGEVWITPASMYPLAVKSAKDGLIAEYQFFQAPPSPFQIPGDQAALLQKEQKAYKAVQSMR